MRDFRKKCDQFWLEFKAKDNVIVHSHERCTFHHIATFHGPPIGGHFSNSPWWRRIQPRLKAWALFEEIEINSSGVKAVIPVSSNIGNSLKLIYPKATDKMTKPGWPGVDSVSVRSNGGDTRKLLFVGREWKRKGLDVVLDAYKRARIDIPSLTLDVYGVTASDLPRSLRRLGGGVNFHGWQQQIPFEKFGLLLHPARVEPFGMIVPEARAAGLSVLISDKVGAAELPLSGVRIIESGASVSEWSEILCEMVKAKRPEPEVCWTWPQLAEWYVSEVYSQLLSA